VLNKSNGMSKIRPATRADAAVIRSIYAPAITRQDVATSFETEVPSVREMEKRIEKKTRLFPWLVMESEGDVIGYTYADPYRERAAYQWSAEVSVYVDGRHHRKGVGRALYSVLFDVLRRQGIVNVYAGIALPNHGSVGLHESLGFELVGIYRGVGFKFGRPHDVGWWHLVLQTWPEGPAPFVPYGSGAGIPD
jgi:L-amino acid N-acyltransferase YncA